MEQFGRLLHRRLTALIMAVAPCLGLASPVVQEAALAVPQVSEVAALWNSDASGDGTLTNNDLTLLARHVAGIEAISDETKLKMADVNADGIISAADLSALAEKLA